MLLMMVQIQKCVFLTLFYIMEVGSESNDVMQCIWLNFNISKIQNPPLFHLMVLLPTCRYGVLDMRSASNFTSTQIEAATSTSLGWWGMMTMLDMVSLHYFTLMESYRFGSQWVVTNGGRRMTNIGEDPIWISGTFPTEGLLQ